MPLKAVSFFRERLYKLRSRHSSPPEDTERHPSTSQSTEHRDMAVDTSRLELSSIGLEFISPPERPQTMPPASQRVLLADDPIVIPLPHSPENNHDHPPPLLWNNIRDLPDETRLFPEQYVSLSVGMQTVVPAGIDEYLVSIIKEVTASGGAPGQVRIIAPDAFFPLQLTRHITVLFGTRAFLVRVVERLPYGNSNTSSAVVIPQTNPSSTRRSRSSEYHGPLVQQPNTRDETGDNESRDIPIDHFDADLNVLGPGQLQTDSIQQFTSYSPFHIRDQHPNHPINFHPFDESPLPPRSTFPLQSIRRSSNIRGSHLGDSSHNPIRFEDAFKDPYIPPEPPIVDGQPTSNPILFTRATNDRMDGEQIGQRLPSQLVINSNLFPC